VILKQVNKTRHHQYIKTHQCSRTSQSTVFNIEIIIRNVSCAHEHIRMIISEGSRVSHED